MIVLPASVIAAVSIVSAVVLVSAAIIVVISIIFISVKTSAARMVACLIVHMPSKYAQIKFCAQFSRNQYLLLYVNKPLKSTISS